MQTEWAAKSSEDWIDRTTGYRCIVLVGPVGSLNGYVAIPPTHPLHGKDYSHRVPLTEEINNRKVSIDRVNLIAMLCQSGNIERDGVSLDTAFDVHGGITFAGAPERLGLTDTNNEWLFGFDTAHSGDRTAFTDGTPRDHAYVRKECIGLAKQLHDFAHKDPAP